MTPEIAEVLEGKRRWWVVEGDCRTVLPTLPNKSISHVITDPPYEAEAHTKQRRILNGGGRRGGGIKAASVSFEPLAPGERECISLVLGRVCRGWVLAFCQVEGVNLWRDAMATAGMGWRRASVWVKPNGQPQLTGDRPAQSFEMIACAWAGHGKSRWNGGGRRGVFIHNVDANFSSEPRVHETQKPLSLMLELVELFTDPGDVILDPYAGSGTTIVAAMRLGRRAIGVERDAKYAAIARARLEAEAQGMSLSAARAGQLPMFGGGGKP